jgi:hypothetical protein
MQLPFEFLYGVDVAIKKLRPGAKFEIQGPNFTWWEDLEGREPPTWEDIQQQIEIDKEAADRWLEKNKDDTCGI